MTNSGEKLINIYQGNDGVAYTDKSEAIDTFQDIKKVTMVNNFNGEQNIEFENQNDALSYYESVIRKELENGTQTDKYNVSGIDMTKDQVLQWIEQTLNIKYQHGNFSWSPNQIPDISEMKLTRADEEKIQPFQPVKNAYWIDYDSKGFTGTFRGPKYITSNESISAFSNLLSTNWERVDSKPINLLLVNYMAAAEVTKAVINNKTD
ncbi:hypothetical protein SCLARK_00744 [Spiroplasma clarkii]|uniref:Uncharacterized protein n=1 Tax=Spiroplasma clarkii TaxID=2139 RepID=A0A1Y0L091_9MOLU|nr:hypothetical protein [Spiroplasma clarkii]ARU91391.1 hypothetical protein SCLARK_00744 [Spiroplasma clarkii]ATX70806.1 hypothetical protein SCLAR_v1c04850 [Spiroplasma clarkii]